MSRLIGTWNLLLGCAAQSVATHLECVEVTAKLPDPSVSWIPLHQILEERKLEVCLVNARHVKNPGRKMDVQDCQWVQYLHSAGL